jgi:probable rRNA maturation factor
MTDPLAIDIDSSVSIAASLIERVQQAVRTTVILRGFTAGSIAVRIATDQEIHAINRQFLDHDYPTDVVSFRYGNQPPVVEGELIVSWETALHAAGQLDQDPWSSEDELCLYAVHGTLHVTGLEDTLPNDAAMMRAWEQRVFADLGWPMPRVLGILIAELGKE